jgi:hypothetical protein
MKEKMTEAVVLFAVVLIAVAITIALWDQVSS